MEKRGALHTILCAGVKRFGLDHASGWIVTMLHLAVALFLAGLIIFLFPVNIIVAWSWVGLISIAAIVYIILSTLPVLAIATDCPYSTPFTPISKIIWRPTRPVLSFILHECLILLACPCFTLLLVASIIKSPRISFRASAQWAWGMVERLLKPPLAICEPLFSQATEINLDPTPSRVQFAVERTLLRTDEGAELEVLFSSFLPILNKVFDRFGSQRFEAHRVIMHFVNNLNIFAHFKALILETSPSDNAVPPLILICRSITVFSVASEVLQLIAHHADKKIPSYPNYNIISFCHCWFDLCSTPEWSPRPDPSLQLIAQAYMATLRSNLCRQMKDHRDPWLSNTLMSKHILAVHGPGVCSSCDKLTKQHSEWSLDEPGTFMPHFDLCNLFTLLDDILATPRSIVHL
jgi:hypothetical protein